jgi:hypothetical protein
VSLRLSPDRSLQTRAGQGRMKAVAVVTAIEYAFDLRRESSASRYKQAP